MMMKGKCTPAGIAWILVIIGAVNWGLMGLGMFFGGNWNLVNLIFGNWMWLEAVVYILVGVAGVYSIFHCKCPTCHAGSMGQSMPMSGGMH